MLTACCCNVVGKNGLKRLAHRAIVANDPRRITLTEMEEFWPHSRLRPSVLHSSYATCRIPQALKVD